MRFSLTNNLSTTFLLLVSVLFLLCNCKKADPLPQNTQTGQNTLGCLIDGKAYVPDGGPAFSGTKPVYGGFFQLYSPMRLGIYIYTYTKDNQRVDILLNNFRLGNHPLKFTTATIPATIAPRDYGLYKDGDGKEFITSEKHMGWVNLTKADTTTGIVAGTFEFQAATQDGKTVNITQGRFDVNHRTQ